MKKSIRQNIAFFHKKTLDYFQSTYLRKIIFESHQLHTSKSNEIYSKGVIGNYEICGQNVSCQLILDNWIRGRERRQSSSTVFFEVSDSFNVGEALKFYQNRV